MTGVTLHYSENEGVLVAAGRAHSVNDGDCIDDFGVLSPRLPATE